MKSSRCCVYYLFTAVLCTVLITGCVGRQYLIVDYQMPMATDKLQGQTIKLRINAQLRNRNVMTLRAARQFKEFNDIYSLAWVSRDRGRVLAGEHDLIDLFQTTFEKRLAIMGAKIAPADDIQAPELVINLESFTIDLKDRQWMADIAYRANLTAEGHPVAKERIRGSAERIKIIGRKGADMVISDIFTKAVNRLDIENLFKNADLIP